MMSARIVLVLSALAILGCAAPGHGPADKPFDPMKSPWSKIRKQRIENLLPLAMQRAAVDAWVVICRENNNDPLAIHVGGENAVGTAAFLFVRVATSVHSIAISPPGEATALREQGIHDTVITLSSGENVWEVLAKQLRMTDPATIAVNSSQRAAADGLSFAQRRALELALGAGLTKRLVSSEELVTQWLSVKLPEEVEIMRKAAMLTAELEVEAYGTIIPGVTRDSDVAHYLKGRMTELGVEDGWAPDQNPNVNSGVDRGHSNATDKVIQAGDFIQTDFGIAVYGIWCTDIQRFAYVLSKGERTPSAETLKKWENSKRGSRTALAAMRPGVRGYDVDKAQRDWMRECGSLQVMWGTGHPVGYWAHDVGPALRGAALATPPAGDAVRLLMPGQVFAFDGFFCWNVEGKEGSTKTLSVEEMALVTDTGSHYLIPPQEELVLVQSR
jgi:Xaa-Pro aminopeptidase